MTGVFYSYMQQESLSGRCLSSIWRFAVKMMSVIREAVAADDVDIESREIRREAAFVELVERYDGIICSICYSFARNKEDFEDFRQDALINLWRGMDGFRMESNLRTWVYRVVLNTCVSVYRRRPGRLEFRMEGEKWTDVCGDDSIASFERMQWMRSMLNELNQQDRALILMWLDELTYDEISDVMGINRNTVATRIRRIKQRLKELSWI